MPDGRFSINHLGQPTLLSSPYRDLTQACLSSTMKVLTTVPDYSSRLLEPASLIRYVHDVYSVANSTAKSIKIERALNAVARKRVWSSF
jgi:hypothetical protein